MPTVRHIWQLIQCGDYAFLVDIKDAYLHIPIIKHHHWFLKFVWQNMPYQWKVLTLGLATGPMVFNALTKPVLFLTLTCIKFANVGLLDHSSPSTEQIASQLSVWY